MASPKHRIVAPRTLGAREKQRDEKEKAGEGMVVVVKFLGGEARKTVPKNDADLGPGRGLGGVTGARRRDWGFSDRRKIAGGRAGVYGR